MATHNYLAIIDNLKTQLDPFYKGLIPLEPYAREAFLGIFHHLINDFEANLTQKPIVMTVTSSLPDLSNQSDIPTESEVKEDDRIYRKSLTQKLRKPPN